MRSNEEILKKNGAGGYVMDDKYRNLFGHRKYLYNAMDEAKKEASIEFFKWNEGVLNGFMKQYLAETDKEALFELTEEKMKFDQLPTEERYNLFLKSLEQK